jgi:hypothetical protein
MQVALRTSGQFQSTTTWGAPSKLCLGGIARTSTSNCHPGRCRSRPAHLGNLNPSPPGVPRPSFAWAGSHERQPPTVIPADAGPAPHIWAISIHHNLGCPVQALLGRDRTNVNLQRSSRAMRVALGTVEESTAVFLILNTARRRGAPGSRFWDLGYHDLPYFDFIILSKVCRVAPSLNSTHRREFWGGKPPTFPKPFVPSESRQTTFPLSSITFREHSTLLRCLNCQRSIAEEPTESLFIIARERMPLLPRLDLKILSLAFLRYYEMSNREHAHQNPFNPARQEPS